MNKWLLSILLASWSLVITNAGLCDTGTAVTGQVLSVQRSLLANADVAFLKGYNASGLSVCLEDCCAAKYGDCTVATFKKSNESESNCLHFNCRPILKCKFLSSKDADSFTFPALPNHPALITTTTSVPSNKQNTTSSTSSAVTLNDRTNVGVTKEEIANFSEEEYDLKNDNTTIKPRKGVENEVVTSGIKPRKGVSLEGNKYTSNFVNRSKVKPRKGVEPYTTAMQSTSLKPSSNIYDINPTEVDPYAIEYSDIAVNESSPEELISDLKMVFEDDPQEIKITSASEVGLKSLFTSSTPSYLTSASFIGLNYSSSVVPTTTSINEQQSSYSGIKPSSVLLPETDTIFTPFLDHSQQSIKSSSESTRFILHSSGTSYSPSKYTNEYNTESAYTTSKHSDIHPTVYTTSQQLFTDVNTMPQSSVDTYAYSASPSRASTETFRHTTETATSHEAGQLYQADSKANDEDESERERKYKSSMHLVLSLVFGLLVLFAVMGVIAKRVYDGWLRRHYRRMDFLIDGMYNGYE